MPTYNLSTSFKSSATITPNVVTVANSFGLGLDRTATFTVLKDLRIKIAPGQVVYITGPSGSGKSTILKMLAGRIKPHLDLNRIRLGGQKPLVDCFKLPLPRALYFLSLAGLADAFLFLRTPSQLSDGQRYRFRLALALARSAKTIFADEFAATLDRICAKVIASNVRKFACQFNITFILATCHDDLYDDLKPDVYIEKLYGRRTLIWYPNQ